jgi:predicted nucleic acid-binding Zn ribbon protein
MQSTHSSPQSSAHCDLCHTAFEAKRTWHRFCSKWCRIEWHNERRRQALKMMKEQEDAEKVD